MAYKDDQYFNLRKEGESLAEPDNAPFIYPSNVVRYAKGNPGYLHEDRITVGRTSVTRPLKRGYIRSLLAANTISRETGEETSTPIRKCGFQFNPATLNQSVQQNTSILNFLQQDAAQYAQPIPGNVSFQFDLFFDRSAELNNPSSSRVSTDDPWNSNGPDQVGVLHDLSKLYSIIGQGLSRDQRDYAQQLLEDQIRSELNRRTAEGEVLEGDATTTYASYGDTTSEFLDLNIGNNAFLLPLPVRVVFSSLYIVEGLVSSLSVVFTKFNAAMVPMQCNVNVLMEAKYIGFAKRNTFFTDVLEQRRQREVDAFNDYAETLGVVLPIVTQELDNVTMHISNRRPTATDDNVFSSGTVVDYAGRATPAYLVIDFPDYKPEDDTASVKSLLDSGANIELSAWYKVISYTQIVANKYVEGDETAEYSTAKDFGAYLDREASSDPDHSIALLRTFTAQVSRLEFIPRGGVLSGRVFDADVGSDAFLSSGQVRDEVDATYKEQRYFAAIKKLRVTVTYQNESFTASFAQAHEINFFAYGDSATPPSSSEFLDTSSNVLVWPRYVAPVGDVPSTVT